jgi:hypothetical protein
VGTLFIIVLLIVFLSLGKNPLKWFQQTRMKNMKKEDEASPETEQEKRTEGKN